MEFSAKWYHNFLNLKLLPLFELTRKCKQTKGHLYTAKEVGIYQNKTLKTRDAAATKKTLIPALIVEALFPVLEGEVEE